MSNEIKRNDSIQNWQASMREALFNGVTPSDMSEIIKTVTAKAKQGDLKAADFLFRWILGTPAPVINVHQTHNVVKEEQVIDIRPRTFEPRQKVETGYQPSLAEIDEQKRLIRSENNGKP